MRLIIIADEAVYEHEVDPSVEVQDVIALVEVETGIPAAQILLSTDTGAPLVASNKTLESYGLKGEVSTIFLSPPQGGSSQPQTSSAAGYETEDQAYERMRQQTLADPTLMSQLRQNNPDVHAAVQAGTRQFKEAMQVMQNASREKARQAELLNSDPYDIEAQKRIEEAIRRERVLENMEHAWEHAPETFGSVTMLYIPVEINGHKVKAFVDSGAQSTIISPACAEECGIMRLLDERFAAMAIGVGTARILGRIHSAQIKLGGLHLPCSFQVLEGKGVDVLFGLDMLKRYQCNIDLAANVLRIQSATVPFLPEHELPRDGLQRQAQEAAEQEKTLAGAGPGSSTQPAASGSGTSGSFPGAGNTMGGNGGASKQASGSGSTGSAPAPVGAVDAARAGKVNEEHVQTLMGLGAERQQAIALLEAAGGNVDYAASMLFGGGAQWP